MSKKRKSTEIRGDWKLVLAGSLVGMLVKVVGWTLRYRVVDPHGLQERFKTDSKPVIFCTWHNCLLSGFLTIRRFQRPNTMVVLTSASRDGSGLAALAKSFGNAAARGSSSRRGRAAMMMLRREILSGNDAGFTPDGPRGPRYALQAGVVKMAQASGAPIIPMRLENSGAWRLKTWDHFRVPKPFSTVTLTLAAPVEVPRRVEEEEFEKIRVDLERWMREGIDDLISEDHDEH